MPGGAAQNGVRRVRPAVPVVGGCQIFPADNWWNTDISGYPLDPNSRRNTSPRCRGIFIPISARIRITAFRSTSCRARSRTCPCTFTTSRRAITGPYPIPPDAQIEGGRHSKGDRHVLVLQQGVCKLYEMWNAYPIHGGKSWQRGIGRDLSAGHEQAASQRLDVGRRRGPADHFRRS